MNSEYFDISGYVYLEHFVTFGVRVDMTEYVLLEVALTESYDFETRRLQDILRLRGAVVRAALRRGRHGRWRGASAWLRLRALALFCHK